VNLIQPGHLAAARLGAALAINRPASGPVAVTALAGASPAPGRVVTAAQYVWIPISCGVALATALVIAIAFARVFERDATPGATFFTRRFWYRPLYATAAWTFTDSWATNITTLGTTVGALVLGLGSGGSLFTGVQLDRFAILVATFGAIIVAAPLVFGLVNAFTIAGHPMGSTTIKLPGPPGNHVVIDVPFGASIMCPGGAYVGWHPDTPTAAQEVTRELGAGARIAVRFDAVISVCGARLALPGDATIEVAGGSVLSVNKPLLLPASGPPGPGAASANAASPLVTLPFAAEIVTSGDSDTLTVTGAAEARLPAAAPASSTPVYAPAGARILLKDDGAAVSVVGTARITVPKHSKVMMRTRVRGQDQGEDAGYASTTCERERSEFKTDMEVLVPAGDVIAADMRSLLPAACVTMFGIGAELGVIGVLVSLATGAFAAKAAVTILLAVMGVLVLAYAVGTTRELADTTPGSALSAQNASFTL
jgi:hypothetical protein